MAEEHDAWLQSTLGVSIDDLKKARDAVSDAVDQTTAAVSQVAQDVMEKGENTVEELKSAVAPAVEAVESTVGDVIGAVKAKAGSVAQDVQEKAGQVVQDLKDKVDQAKTAAQDVVDDAAKSAADRAKILSDAIASYAPVISIPNVGDINVAATLDQAANQVVANHTTGRLPFLTRAEVLLEEARLIVESGMSPNESLDLPNATVRFTGKCCTGPELNGFLNAIEGPRNALRLSLNAYNDSQRAIEDACEQGKRICYGALATCLLGTVIGPGVGGTAACLAGSIACIGGASPVQNAIRVQIKAKEDLEIASGALERALGNYRFSYKFRCPELLPVDPAAPPKQ